MLIADVRLRLRPDAADTFEAVTGAFVQASREEPGCLDFQLLRVDGEPDRVVLLERWTDMAAFDAYLGSDAFAAFRERVVPLLAAPPESVYYDASVADRAVVR